MGVLQIYQEGVHHSYRVEILPDWQHSKDNNREYNNPHTRFQQLYRRLFESSIVPDTM